jgi:hypothetical protein
MTEAPSRPVRQPQDHRPPNGSARVAANLGQPITLTDGEQVTLRYTMRGLARIEDTVGPLGTIQDALGGGERPMIRPLVALLAAGLDDPRLTPEALLDLLDVARLSEYATAIAQALETALPAQDPPANPPTPQDAQATGSPGATYSSQPPAGASGSTSSGTT